MRRSPENPARRAPRRRRPPWWTCWGRLHCIPSRHRTPSPPFPSSSPTPTPTPPPPPLLRPPPPSPASADPHLLPLPSSPSHSSAADSVWAAVPPSSPASIPYTDATPSPTAVLTTSLFPSRSAPLVDSSSSPLPPPLAPTPSTSILEPQRLLRPIFFDSVLVTPPLASTLTTEPTTPLSTAPFTPPPELAHLTTPPSPEVPFAQLLSPPRGAKSGPLPSLELVYRLCPGSPSAHSPTAPSSPPPPHPFSLFAAAGGGNSVPRLRTQDPPRNPISQDAEESSQVRRAQRSPAENVSQDEDVLEAGRAGGGPEKDVGDSAGVYMGGAAHLMARSPVRALERFVESVLSEAQGSCSECKALNSKCEALSQALHNTKEKLNCIQQHKETSAAAAAAGDREQKFKQIIHWMQIEAKSQAESIFRLSDELSWQETAFLDMQEQRLADLGIDLHGVNRELSSTEVS